MTPEPKARVLAVDDEEALLRYYQRAVGSAGYEVVTCERPSDALAELDKARFDVIITDLVRSEERRVGKECRSRWSPYH